MNKSVIIIPTYNEKENVEQIITAALKQSPDYHVLIVDDNSPDGTAEIVLRMQKDLGERLHILQRTEKAGLGTAYIAGFRWSLDHDYDYIFEMDADFSHNPADLPRLLKPILEGKADLTVGSRYVSKGGVENWPLNRQVLSYGASLYVRLITWMRVKDPTAGFVCYHRKVLEALALDQVQFVGYAFQIEMKYRSHVKGFKIVEVPIIFKDREVGTSKMSTKIISEAIYGVIKLRRQKILGQL